MTLDLVDLGRSTCYSTWNPTVPLRQSESKDMKQTQGVSEKFDNLASSKFVS